MDCYSRSSGVPPTHCLQLCKLPPELVIGIYSLALPFVGVMVERGICGFTMTWKWFEREECTGYTTIVYTYVLYYVYSLPLYH